MKETILDFKPKDIKKNFWDMFLSILKILITSLVSTLFTSSDQTTAKGKLIVIITIVYIVVSIIVFLLKQVVFLIFGNRFLSSKKEKAFMLFHNNIKKDIELGMDYTEKLKTTIKVALSVNTDSIEGTKTHESIYSENTLLLLSQSIYCFENAIKALEELLPKCEASHIIKEKSNYNYVKYIGFSHLLIYIKYGETSLSEIKNLLVDFKTMNKDDADNQLFEDIETNLVYTIIPLYESLYKRVKKIKSNAENYD